MKRETGSKVHHANIQASKVRIRVYVYWIHTFHFVLECKTHLGFREISINNLLNTLGFVFFSSCLWRYYSFVYV